MTAIAEIGNTFIELRGTGAQALERVHSAKDWYKSLAAEGEPAGVLGQGDILAADGLTHRDARRFLNQCHLAGAALCYGSDIITPKSVAESLASFFTKRGPAPIDLVLRSLGAVTYFDGLRTMMQQYPEVEVPVHRSVFMLSAPRTAGDIHTTLGLLPKIGWSEFWLLPGSIATELTGIKGATVSNVRQAFRQGIDTLPDKQTAAQWRQHPNLLRHTTPWRPGELARALVADYTRVTLIGSTDDRLVHMSPAAERWAADFDRQNNLEMEYYNEPVGHADVSPLDVASYLRK